MRIITLGTFDLFHYGHMRLFQKCKELAGPEGHVTVAVNTDEFIEKYKGKPPVMDYVDRCASIRIFDPSLELVPNSQSDGSAKQLISNNAPDLIVIGSDWARKDYVGQLGLDWDWLDHEEIGICYVNYTEEISTTRIKEMVRDN